MFVLMQVSLMYRSASSQVPILRCFKCSFQLFLQILEFHIPLSDSQLKGIPLGETSVPLLAHVSICRKAVSGSAWIRLSSYMPVWTGGCWERKILAAPETWTNTPFLGTFSTCRLGILYRAQGASAVCYSFHVLSSSHLHFKYISNMCALIE